MARRIPDELMFLVNARAPQKCSEASAAGKVCIVTGATSGVGLQAARRLARGGATLILVCRNPEKGRAVGRMISDEFHVPVEVIFADFMRLETVRAAADEILAKHPRLDVLVNNAGMHSTTRSFTPEGLETVLCVNHLAPFLLTRLLLPRLLESGSARIIDVNSEGHRFCAFDPEDLGWKKRHYTGLKSYGASKTAQLLTVWEFADRIQGTGTTIIAAHPGDVRTNIGGNNGWLYRGFSKLVTNRFLKDASRSGEAIYYLAVDPEMRGISGRFYHLTVEETPMKHAMDRTLGKRVWAMSSRLTGLPVD
jgi:NAD(P)-dependent dehydrogenase (short-subunit alcohol dehydrogenase family)